MGVIFNQLGHLFLQAIPTVILVFFLFIVLDWIFFRPVLAVLKQREELTVGALARAREHTAAAEAKARQYDEAFQAARQDVYRQREADRKANVERREAALRLARQEAEAVISAARASLAEEVINAKAELDVATRPLAEDISQTLVGTPSAGEQGGLQV